MFRYVCSQLRKSIYGIIASTIIGKNKINYVPGSGFMISRGIILTASHVVHLNATPNQPVHKLIEVIRAPDVGQKMEIATFIDEDKKNDLAILRINDPRSTESVVLEPRKVSIGTICGSLGYPMSQVVFTQSGKQFTVIERFQGAFISAYHIKKIPSENDILWYERDTLMYEGSSGCPVFSIDGTVLGMQKGYVTGKMKKGERERTAMSLVVPSINIIELVQKNGIPVIVGPSQESNKSD